MSFDLMLEIGKCNLCDKKAEVVYIRSNILMHKTRMFCNEHARIYREIKKD